MIMCTCKKICITNRKLVDGDFLEQLRRIVENGVDAVILREKDLTEKEYELLAKEALEICASNRTMCLLHSFKEAARRLEHPYIHLPMPLFLELTEEERRFFKVIGVSTHTVEEAKTAENRGADYITASHIFPTDCKPDLAPRGLEYLKDVLAAVDIEVYALGGIHPENAGACIEAGADGICMMSEYMKSKEGVRI